MKNKINKEELRGYPPEVWVTSGQNLGTKIIKYI